jgi:hypothetical protein
MRGGVLLDPTTGRPETDPRPFEIDPHTGRPDRDLASILAERGMDEIAEYLARARGDSHRGYTRNKHYIAGRNAATAATLRNVAAAIWNPHSTSRIFVYEIWSFPSTAGATNLGVARITARGTASTSITAALDHSIERDTAAPSGFILDLAYSAQPTVSASDMQQSILPATIGNGMIWGFSDPITVPPGTGLALITITAAAYPISAVTFCVGD